MQREGCSRPLKFPALFALLTVATGNCWPNIQAGGYHFLLLQRDGYKRSLSSLPGPRSGHQSGSQQPSCRRLRLHAHSGKTAGSAQGLNPACWTELHILLAPACSVFNRCSMYSPVRFSTPIKRHPTPLLLGSACPMITPKRPSTATVSGVMPVQHCTPAKVLQERTACSFARALPGPCKQHCTRLLSTGMCVEQTHPADAAAFTNFSIHPSWFTPECVEVQGHTANMPALDNPQA